MQHIFIHCTDPRLESFRNNAFGSRSLDALRLKELEINELLHFAREIRLEDIMLMKNEGRPTQ